MPKFDTHLRGARRSPVKVPDHVREQIRGHFVDASGTELAGRNLSAIEKTRYYESWTSDGEIGGVLHSYMDTRKIRTYLKDAVFKRTLERVSATISAAFASSA